MELLPPEGAAATGDALRDARLLRGWCWAVLDAQRDDRVLPTDALAGLLDTARRGVDDAALRSGESTVARTVDGALCVLALRALTLVLRPLPQPIRACDRCGWFFVDTSRSRRRRWCSMQTCGNQAKAARHRAGD